MVLQFALMLKISSNEKKIVTKINIFSSHLINLIKKFSTESKKAPLPNISNKTVPQPKGSVFPEVLHCTKTPPGLPHSQVLLNVDEEATGTLLYKSK